MKLQKLHDPYKGITYVSIPSLIALLEDAKAHPEKYDPASIERLCKEIVSEGKAETVEKPF